MHASPERHTRPHAPQFALSAATATQSPWQRSSPPAHPIAPHAPPVHTAPAGQRRPHAPQWVTSVARSAHTPSQGICGGAHGGASATSAVDASRAVSAPAASGVSVPSGTTTRAPQSQSRRHATVHRPTPLPAIRMKHAISESASCRARTGRHRASRLETCETAAARSGGERRLAGARSYNRSTQRAERRAPCPHESHRRHGPSITPLALATWYPKFAPVPSGLESVAEGIVGIPEESPL